MKAPYRVEFKTEDDAKAVGYKLNVRCHPLDENVPLRGNKTAKAYFFPRCQFGYNNIPEEVLATFKNRAEAEAAGYRIGPTCH